MNMATIVMAVLTVLTFGNPILLTWMLVQRFAKERSERPTWRTRLFWIALPSATVAVVLFWAATPYGPTAPSQDDLLFRRMFRASILAAAIALLAAIAAKGKDSKWIALSALITPCSWFWALMLV